MEALLGLLFGVSLLLLAAVAAARKGGVERERRLRDELEALRRSSRPAPALFPSALHSPASELPARPARAALPGQAGSPTAEPFLAGTTAGAAEPPPDAYRASAALEELATRLRALESALSQIPAGADLGPFDPGPLPVLPPIPPPDDEALALLEAEQALEELSDEASRLGDRLRSGDEAAARVSESLHAAQSQIAVVEARAGTASPLAAELSGLADRLNLLALNLALLATGAGPAGEPFHASAAELRGLFEETRRLSRELSAHGQGSAEAARRAGEAASPIVQGAVDQQAKERRGSERLARVRDLAGRLGESLERARTAAAAREEHVRQAEGASRAILRALAGERQAREDERRAAAEILSRLGAAGAASAAARRAADEATESLRSRRG